MLQMLTSCSLSRFLISGANVKQNRDMTKHFAIKV